MRAIFIGRRIIFALDVLLIMMGPMTSLKAQSAPWTPERKLAVVRIEIWQQGIRTNVGTGFVVKGQSDHSYVLTSTHVLLPKYDPNKPFLAGCNPLPNGILLRQGNSGGAEIVGRCFYPLESDASLVELEPRDNGYAALAPLAADLAKDADVSLAGFPLGNPRVELSGKVTLLSGPDGTIVTNVNTAEGMSGGPNINSDGMVVGIHRGGGLYAAGFAHMTPISAIRTSLEKYLPPIPTVPPPRVSYDSGQCINEKLEELRNQREPFTYQERIACGPDQKLKYNVREKKPGYVITGFVSHADKVHNSWVGMLRYATEALNTIEVQIPVECNASDTTTNDSGWAEIKLVGFLHRIEENDARSAVTQACSAPGTQSRPIE